MKRPLLALIAALLTWAIAATVLNRLLRMGLPNYAVAETSFALSLAMLLARLALGGMSSIIAGVVLARLAPAGARLPLVLGGLLLLMFIPVHYELWSKFPPWYHVIFLASLLPLVVLGARCGVARSR